MKNIIFWILFSVSSVFSGTQVIPLFESPVSPVVTPTFTFRPTPTVVQTATPTPTPHPSPTLTATPTNSFEFECSCEDYMCYGALTIQFPACRATATARASATVITPEPTPYPLYSVEPTPSELDE